MLAQRSSTFDQQMLHKIGPFVSGAVRKAWTALREGRLSRSPVWWFRALGLHWLELEADGTPPPRVPTAMDRARTDESYRQWLRSGPPQSDTAVASTRISVVVIVHDSAALGELVESVRLQMFTNWDLFLAWPGAVDRQLARDRSDSDQRRCVNFEIGGLVRADKSWLPPGISEFVVLLDTSTTLARDAFTMLLPALPRHDVDWIYTDDDCRGPDGAVSDPNLKGAFSPELALVDDYATRLAAVRRSAIERVGGLRADAGAAQIYDLLLRVAETPDRAHHVPGIGCHRRQPTSGTLSQVHRRAAERILQRRLPSGSGPVAIELRGSPDPAGLSVQWPAGPTADLRVTIVIPTRDHVDLLRACMDSLRKTVDVTRAELLIVDDSSREKATRTFLDALEADTLFRCRVIRPTRVDGRFNYSRLMNAAAREVETPLMLQLNNDTVATTAGWLDQMAGWLALPDIGVVGARLVHPDGSIQHAGVMVTPPFGPEHMFRRLKRGDPGYQWLPYRARNVAAVTGACLLTRTALYRDLGGFDEQNLPVQFNDVDFCLKVIQAGKRIVYEPWAVLIHHLSSSRGSEYDHRENLFFFDKYKEYRDPFVSPLLDLRSVCGPTPLVATPGSGRPDTNRNMRATV